MFNNNLPLNNQQGNNGFNQGNFGNQGHGGQPQFNQGHDQHGQQGQMGSQQMPGGNWTQSARNQSYNQGWLKAELKNQHGQWIQAQIQCQPHDQFQNINGVFQRQNQGNHNQGNFNNNNQQNNNQHNNQQNNNQHNHNQNNQQMPKGNWKHSARNFSYQNGWLKAELKNMQGQWMPAQIAAQPHHALSNNNGQFQHDQNQGQGQNFNNNNNHNHNNNNQQNNNQHNHNQNNQQMPKGTWQQSARNYSYQNGVLRAELKNAHGQWIQTQVQCQSHEEFDNNNGNFQRKQGNHNQGNFNNNNQHNHNQNNNNQQNYNQNNYNQQMPQGTWLNSARNQSYQNGWLKAELKNAAGMWVSAQVQCQPNQRFDNNNGHFQAEHH